MRRSLLGILLALCACGGGTRSSQAPEMAPLPGETATPVAHDPNAAGPAGLTAKESALTEERCRATLNHVFDLIVTTVAEENRAQAEGSRGEMIEELMGPCMREFTPEIADCLDRARTPDDLDGCKPPGGSL